MRCGGKVATSSALEPDAGRTPQTLSSIAAVKEVPPLSAAANQFLEAMIADFGPTQAEEVKKFEATTNHDVKAVEYAIKRCAVSGGVDMRTERSQAAAQALVYHA